MTRARDPLRCRSVPPRPVKGTAAHLAHRQERSHRMPRYLAADLISIDNHPPHPALQRNSARTDVRHGRRQIATIALPGLQAAIQHSDRCVPQPVQHPPQTRRDCTAGVVINHHLCVVIDPPGAHRGSEGRDNTGRGWRPVSGPIGPSEIAYRDLRTQRLEHVRQDNHRSLSQVHSGRNGNRRPASSFIGSRWSAS